MSTQHAVLIGNAVSYGITDKDIPATVVHSFVSDLADRLENLGEFSFATTPIINKGRNEARNLIDRAVRKAKGSDLLLIYYFGHGVRSLQQDELFFYFKDSDWEDEATMLSFKTNILTLLTYNRIQNCIIILDCCYAGIVRDAVIDLGVYKKNIFLMASVTHKYKAIVDYNDQRPIGLFSKFILAAFTDPAARSGVLRQVTPMSFFSYALRKTRETSKQEPFFIDLGLGQATFFNQVSTFSVPDAVRRNAPIKSVYHKIYRLSTFLLAQNFRKLEQLYSFIVQKRPIEFLTPFKIDENTTEYNIMSKSAFVRYVELGQILGVIEIKESIALSDLGKKMVRKEGAVFNSLLFETVKKQWSERYNVEIQEIEDVVRKRINLYGIATIEGIYRDLYLIKKKIPSKPLFKTLLDLTAYVGVLKFSREPAYFHST